METTQSLADTALDLAVRAMLTTNEVTRRNLQRWAAVYLKAATKT